MYKRAAILIGVNHSGKLPAIKAAASARMMEKWAIEKQGIDPSLVKVFTDEQKIKVFAKDIKNAVKEIVDQGGVDQIIIYFAGHGFSRFYTEYWLLSNGPEDPQEAINVGTSVVLARHIGIPHVVLISDTCRTIPVNIQAHGVTGSEMFQNEGANQTESAVDQFFACLLGNPAYEYRTANTAARNYSAVYTAALYEALCGNRVEVMEIINEGEGETGFVRPRPLKRYLGPAVSELINKNNLRVTQIPDARIESDEDAWMARFPSVPKAITDRRLDGVSTIGARCLSYVSYPPDLPEDLPIAIEAILRAAVAGDRALVKNLLQIQRTRTRQDAMIVNSFAKKILQLEVQDSFQDSDESCVLRVRGATVIEACSDISRVELQQKAGALVYLPGIKPHVMNVALRLDSGRGALLPAISGFVTSLTFDNGDLENVTFDPVAEPLHWRWLGKSRDDLCWLRAVMTSAAREGLLRFDKVTAQSLADQMNSKGVDPILLALACYSFCDLGLTDLVPMLSNKLHEQLDVRLFDVELITHSLNEPGAFQDKGVFPFVPLLSRGWALLPSYQVQLPPSLRDLRHHVVPSLWTLFDEEGTTRIFDAMRAGEVL